ncbi:hypothetical protein FPB55_17800 [Pseudomonas sp. BJP69]|nr:hypothetical protein FPB55_17800 [Pseudomonas sp. BJP69]
MPVTSLRMPSARPPEVAKIKIKIKINSQIRSLAGGLVGGAKPLTRRRGAKGLGNARPDVWPAKPRLDPAA